MRNISKTSLHSCSLIILQQTSNNRSSSSTPSELWGLTQTFHWWLDCFPATLTDSSHFSKHLFSVIPVVSVCPPLYRRLPGVFWGGSPFISQSAIQPLYKHLTSDSPQCSHTLSSQVPAAADLSTNTCWGQLNLWTSGRKNTSSGAEGGTVSEEEGVAAEGRGWWVGKEVDGWR